MRTVSHWYAFKRCPAFKPVERERMRGDERGTWPIIRHIAIHHYPDSYFKARLSLREGTTSQLRSLFMSAVSRCSEIDRYARLICEFTFCGLSSLARSCSVPTPRVGIGCLYTVL